MVSNVRIEGNMTAQEDYHFTATVTWNPPVYPYKTPSSYLVKWFKENSLKPMEFQFAGLFSSVSEIFFWHNIFFHLTIITFLLTPRAKLTSPRHFYWQCCKTVNQVMTSQHQMLIKYDGHRYLDQFISKMFDSSIVNIGKWWENLAKIFVLCFCCLFWGLPMYKTWQNTKGG